MKLKSFILAALALTGFAGNVVAQTDVTSTYLTNADFSTGTPIDNNVCTYGKDMSANGTTYYGAQTISGWTNASVGDTDSGYANSKLAGALFAYGSTPWLAGSGTSAPATGPTGAAGNAAGLCAVWGGSIQYTQAVTLPAGSYTIVYKVYNATTNNGSGKFITTNLFGFVEDGGTTHYAPNKTFAIGQWSTVAVTFNLAASTAGKISMGFVGPSGNANMPHLFVDNVKILKNEYYTDKSSSVNATSWTTPAGNDGLQGTAFTRSDGASVRLQASYGSSAAGRKIYQTVSGLDNGSYEVVVYAFSMNEWSNHSATLANDAGDVGYVFAEGAYELKEWINARQGTHNADDYGIYTISGVKVTDGTMTVGYALDKANQTEWQGFQVQSLIYTNPVDLSSYAEARDVVKASAIAAISSNLVPTACENAIQDAVDAYGGDYNSEEEYTYAQAQIQSALDTYFTDDIKSAYAAYYDYKSKVEGLMTGISDGETKTTFTNAISTASSNVEDATITATINAEITNLRSAAMTFISTTEGQFDITFLADLDNGWTQKRVEGEIGSWEAPEWSVPRPEGVTHLFRENYTEEAGGESLTGNVLYNTMADMPAGYYTVGLYAAASYTPNRGSLVEKCSDGQLDITYGFANDSRISLPVYHRTSLTLADEVPVNVSVQLTQTGNLTFGVQKDAAGSNWHVAQVASIIYSKDPDLTILKADRDMLVSEAEGILAGSSQYLTEAQQTALNGAITSGNNANNYEDLITVTQTTLPNAINTAKTQIAQAKAAVPVMLAALERFENDYNLADGTDYRRVTMSAEAWTTLLTKVNAVSTALDDISQASTYATKAQELVAQMDATDASLRLFKSYKAMVEGTTALDIVGNYGADSNMDTDATEQSAIAALNTAFDTYAAEQTGDFDVSAFLGENLDFSAAAGSVINGENSNTIKNVTGWEVYYADADTWAVIQTDQSANNEKLYMRKNWGSSATTLEVFKEKMLPVGKYQLSLSWDSNMENMTNLSCYKLGNSSTAIGENTSEAENKTLTYDFAVSEPTPFDLVIGFQKKNTGDAAAQIVVDNVALTYIPTIITLADAADNTTTISDNEGNRGVVTLSGRTLYKDNSWNTLCLPFDMTAEQVTAQLAPDALMELDIQENSNYEHVTGLDGTTLYLNFKTANSITAGKPYIIKWGSGNNVTNPTFNNVIIVGDAASSVGNGGVTFVGTYDPVPFTKDDKTKLYLGADDKLYWAGAENFQVNAFRAYFILSDPNAARQFVLNFGDEASGVSEIVNSKSSNGKWFDLQGRNLGSQPSKAGLYINNGKKIIIK